MLKILFFDLDGTLLDTLEDLHQAVNDALRAFAYPSIEPEQTRAYIGQGTEVFLKKACAGSCPTGLAEHYRSYYDQHLTVHTKPYPGMLELIEDIKSRYILIVHTNKYQQAAQDLVEHFFPGAFHHVLGDGHYARKPDPEGVLKTLEHYGFSPEEALFIGDSAVDAETAARAGIACRVTAWGYGTPLGTTDIDTLRKILVQQQRNDDKQEKKWEE